MSFPQSAVLRRIAVALVTALSSVSPAPARELLTFEGSVPVSVRARSQLDFWKPQESVTDSGPKPEGRAVRLRGETGGGFAVNTTSLVIDWRQVESVGLWLHRSADEAKEHPTVELVLRLSEEDQKASFWRRIEVSHVGWQKLVLPLEWFVWSDGRMPRWEKVKFVGVQLRDPGVVTLDTVWAEPSAQLRDEFPATESLTKLAFPKNDPSNLRTLETRDVQLVTNVKSLELERLATHLGLVSQRLHRELPFLSKPSRGALLFVFQERAEYQRFAPRIARQLNSHLDPPEAGGYTLQGISSSWWDEKQGSLRPVYTHEFVHGYLSRTLPLSTTGDWVQEGLAAHIQLEFHPQENLSQLVREGLKSSSTPFAELCSGRPINTSRYWQAATLWRMFLGQPSYQSKLKELLERLAAANSTDLGPHLEPLWGTNFDKLTADWRAFCEQQFRRDE
ncbi:hypothetical protein LBMAG52_19890 [Planctomycetia bacterium]|nr:hypothetical protein LBMAG52_19890 [Planctomycetia bacterium]